ncbi:nucleotide pyrophosphohydrolase [Photobacterium damselae]|uniref:nucleotide pyrophosphohydrolase n=1 Tax=Photobacterium damselae TaxID=38293 RepID=UPI00406955FA
MSELQKIQQQLRDFANERNWEQFHSPKNLVMALSGEVGELTEIYQWLTAEQSENLSVDKKQHASEEMADIMLYLIRLADRSGIDLIAACQAKLEKNAQKYPSDKCYGSAKKYNEL